VSGGPAFTDVLEFAADNQVWQQSYMEAWAIATTNGHSDLKTLRNPTEPEEEEDIVFI